jgi:thiol:disulfide interchange protein DsbA
MPRTSVSYFVTTCLLFLSLFVGKVFAADAEKPTVSFTQGEHYQVLAEPLPQGVAAVTEFFYFGCRSCYQLAPAIAEWSQTTRIPVGMVPAHAETAMADAARLYHTFAQMGVLGKMYELGYVMFQTDEVKLQGKARIDSYLERHDVNKDTFWATWSSSAVEQRLAGSLMLTKMAKITKTPTFVVHGRYVVDLESLESVEQLFELLEHLVKEKQPQAPALIQKL